MCHGSRKNELENLTAYQNKAKTYQLPLPDALVCGVLKAFEPQSPLKSVHASPPDSSAAFPFLAVSVVSLALAC